MYAHHRVFWFIGIATVLLISFWYTFDRYHPELYSWFGVSVPYTLYIEELAISVTVADESLEWQQGLSGIPALPELTGKFFIFDTNDRFGMWMKDMLIPIDIIWIDDTYTIVHIEQNVTPDTYPKTFVSPVDARFVLETNAFFTESFKIATGQQIRLPQTLIPVDLQ